MIRSFNFIGGEGFSVMIYSVQEREICIIINTRGIFLLLGTV